jgi:hypothetical protein
MQMGKTTYGAGGSRRYGRRRLWASVTHCHRNRPLRFCRAAWSGRGVRGQPSRQRINKETAIVARTPLLHFLKTLSSDVTRCQGRDISASELLAERLAAPSRRQFVAEAAIAAASAALPAAALAAPSKARIAIVGAGIAGLNAALTLQDYGIADMGGQSSQ